WSVCQQKVEATAWGVRGWGEMGAEAGGEGTAPLAQFDVDEALANAIFEWEG
ncbi:hypothetical protein FRB94_006524, partial [Tulasnella sp. JGI-2019a]